MDDIAARLAAASSAVYVVAIFVGNAMQLVAREHEVLDLIAAGRSNAELAAALVLSPKTERNHVSNIFTKLHVADRSAAIVRAREAGLGIQGGPR